MPTDTLVGQVMTTEVVSLDPGQSVRDAARALLAADVDGAPVVDAVGTVVGMLTTGDLIVQEGEVEAPAAISLLGAIIPLVSQHHFERELHRVLGSTVAEVMASDPVTIASTATIGQAVALMTDHRVSRLPVVDDGSLVGIIGRSDIVRVLLEDLGPG